MARRWIWIVPIVIAAAAALWFAFGSRGGGIAVYSVDVVAETPHNPTAFTEGLFFQDGVFYESTGEEGESGIRKVDPKTGETLAGEALPPPYFGEGIVAWGDKLYQLTWKDGTGFIYKLGDFSLTGTFNYTGEGWGITHDDTSLIMSDGTPTLRFLDPNTLKPTRTLDVTANGCPVKQLNELEWIDGEIYANIWQTDLIARIDPKTGKVNSFLDVTPLGPEKGDIDDVANGIAWDAGAKRLFVTGKRWPKLYEVKQGKAIATPDQATTIMTCDK